MQNNRKKPLLSIKEIVLFAILGTIMFCSKIVMDALPNIHLLGMFIMTFTITFRKKALIPIYVYVFLCGIYGGFSSWWVPYLYVWTVLWGITMLLPKKMPKAVACVIYPIVCCLHGLLFGVIYAPAQALLFGLGTKATIAWIIAGFPFDLIHGISNLLTGTLIYPIAQLLKKISK